jgi:hypothetical protein
VRISGKSIEVVTDPQEGTKVKADVVTWSAPADAGAPNVSLEGAVVLDGPGDYEVKGSSIIGAPAKLHIDESGLRGQRLASPRTA